LLFSAFAASLPFEVMFQLPGVKRNFQFHAIAMYPEVGNRYFENSGSTAIAIC